MSKSLLQVLVEENITSSFGEGRRLIANGAVSVGNMKVIGIDLELGAGKHEIKVGRKKISKEIK